MGGQNPERMALQGLGRGLKEGGWCFVCELGGGGGSPCQASGEASCVAQTLFYFSDRSGPG